LENKLLNKIYGKINRCERKLFQGLSPLQQITECRDPNIHNGGTSVSTKAYCYIIIVRKHLFNILFYVIHLL